MPLETRILRDGQPLRIGWGTFHAAAMILAAATDDETCELHRLMKEHDELAPEGERVWLSPRSVFDLVSYHVIAATPLNSGGWTLTRAYAFGDCVDGEEFDLLPGDQLMAWRS